MADMGYDFDTNDPNWFDVVRPTKLPSFSGEFAPNGKVYFSVRQTRFGEKSFNPTSAGDFKTILEFDLFGTGVDAGQTTLHLRHAYGSLGQIGAGQFWSVFVDPDIFPNTLEYWGPNGSVNFRNIQLRWTPIQKKGGHLMFALERPGASADQGVYRDRIELQGVVPRFNMPDLSWNGRISRGWGYAQLAGIFRKIGWVDTNNDAFNLSGTAFGWGLSASSNLKFSKSNVGKFQFTYGRGVENYMNDAPVDIGVENNFGNRVTPIKGVALPVTGVVAFLDHSWSDRFTSSVGYSMLNIANSDAQLRSDFHQGHYALANLLYNPIPRVTMGSEVQFGRRLNISDGFNVNDYRLNLSFKYNWSKAWSY
jgi:DcaP outer membrane protein